MQEKKNLTPLWFCLPKRVDHWLQNSICDILGRICRKRRRGQHCQSHANGRMALTSRLSFIVIPPLESTPNVYCTHRKRKKAPHLPERLVWRCGCTSWEVQLVARSGPFSFASQPSWLVCQFLLFCGGALAHPLLYPPPYILNQVFLSCSEYVTNIVYFLV